MLLAGDSVAVCAAEDVATAAPDKASQPWEKGSIKVGGFLTAFDSNLSFGVKDYIGVIVDAEDVLGLDSGLTVWRADAMIRPGKRRRHQFDFSYAGFHRRGKTTLTEEIEIGDNILLPGTAVESLFNFDIYRLTYSYALLQDSRMRIAIGLGIYGVPLRYSIDFSVADQSRLYEHEDATLPLPSLALRSEFQLVPKLFLYADINAMYLAISDFRGSLMDASVGLEYRPWKHLGLGLAYNPLSVHVEAEDNRSRYPGVDFLGVVNVDYHGLLLYGKFSF